MRRTARSHREEPDMGAQRPRERGYRQESEFRKARNHILRTRSGQTIRYYLRPNYLSYLWPSAAKESVLSVAICGQAI